MENIELAEKNLPIKIILPKGSDVKFGCENNDYTNGRKVITITSYESLRRLKERSINPTDNLNKK